jgi:hypothetical protein
VKAPAKAAKASVYRISLPYHTADLSTRLASASWSAIADVVLLMTDDVMR